MPDTVPVMIEVEPAAAAAFGDEAKRAWVGRVVSRMLQPTSVDRLLTVMDEISVEARRRTPFLPGRCSVPCVGTGSRSRSRS